MSDLRQAALQALEALRSEYPAVRLYAVQALEKALAEPEQEVEQALEALNKMQSILMMKDGRHPRDVLRAFIQQAAPTPRKPLTDQQIEALDNLPSYPSDAEVIAFARRIEQAHGIK